MSQMDAMVVASHESEPPHEPRLTFLQLVERASDRLNPILVKEARQALKSRVFAVTFISVLLLAWAWSIFGVALQSPGIYYAPGGAYLLMGYLMIMALPLIVVVPAASFRSMAAEREDGTFELVSITNLKPWQLITGKLSSALLQILIYLSALAPCMAFTYFLRGVDIFMISLMLVVGVMESLGLSSLALLMASQTRPQRMQTVASVVLLLLLVGVAIATCSIEFGVLSSGLSIPVRDPRSWVVATAVITMWGCGLCLLVLAAAAAVTFASDNHATKLRIAALVTHAIWFGWMTWVWQTVEHEASIVYMYLMPTTVFWWFCGSCMSGEPTKLTPRVRRTLPSTSLGRMFGMLFFPGRGLGYFFAVGNVLTMVGVSALVAYVSDGRHGDEVITTSVLCAGYVIGYLGMGNLLMRCLGKYHRDGAFRGVLMNLLLLVFGILVPLTIHMSYPRTFGTEYNVIEISNVIWTTYECVDGDIGLTPTAQWFPIPYLVVAFALIMMLVNLLLAAREMNIGKMAVPQRVEREIASLVSSPATAAATSPWDEPQAR